MARTATSPRSALPADAWVDAALDALAEGGLTAVAIEPLARRLGTTKGSFYHHFRNRDALIVAALERWERTFTEDAIQQHLDLIRDPRDRLRVLIRATLRDRQAGLRDAAISASADHPLVKPVLERVTARRMDYITAAFTELGWAPDEAHRRALITYSTYAGLFHYVRAAPPPGPADDELETCGEELIDALVAPPSS